ncbi:hypothetical protein QR680_010081 [Steinernema hermaphroditum]|uniref:Uncharacterized protein n=1 Tax=Steinernema hermaphroditum TaxID=289476 RepID=A0AA39IPK0_9BILA|nr:hypothetical protein QR680_010081 [Steinernema hermaphroditum]
MLFFGFTFVICFHRAKKGHKATTSSKINYCVKYMFMVHGTITVTAHITDFAALKAGILIANYIGYMLKQVALFEFLSVILLCTTTLTFQIFIYRQKPLRLVWDKSPSLCLFFISITLLAVQDITLSCQWILFGLGIVKNGSDNTFFLLIVAHFGLIIRQFHNCATIALFAQRVHHLLRPTHNVKKFNHTVLGVLFLFFTAGSTTATYNMVVHAKSNGRPVPDGCFSFNCMAPNGASVRLWSSIFTVCITVVIMVLGSYMLYLLHRYRKSKQSVIDRKRNKFALYVFYVRFVCETIPFLVDVLLSTTAGIDLGKIVGPFGALGSATDFTIKTVVYFFLTRQHKTSGVALYRLT